MSKHPLAMEYDLSTVHGVVSGAAPLGEEQEKEFGSRFPKIRLRQAYGMTELSGASHLTPIHGSKTGSSGNTLSNMECKVLDLETGESLGPKMDGEIYIRGPLVMKGYLNNPTATSATVLADGFLKTGDIGHYDEEGFYFFVDRVKELIKYNAFQVPPAELESLLLTHPDVADAAVIGVPDDIAGELPKAYVQRKPNATVMENDIIKFVADHVASYKRLRGGVEFLDTIPKSASGKILRRFLREKAKASKKRTISSKL